MAVFIVYESTLNWAGNLKATGYRKSYSRVAFVVWYFHSNSKRTSTVYDQSLERKVSFRGIVKKHKVLDKGSLGALVTL